MKERGNDWDDTPIKGPILKQTVSESSKPRTFYSTSTKESPGKDGSPDSESPQPVLIRPRFQSSHQQDGPLCSMIIHRSIFKDEGLRMRQPSGDFTEDLTSPHFEPDPPKNKSRQNAFLNSSNFARINLRRPLKFIDSDNDEELTFEQFLKPCDTPKEQTPTEDYNEPPTISTNRVMALKEIPDRGLRFRDYCKIVMLRCFHEGEIPQSSSVKNDSLENQESSSNSRSPEETISSASRNLGQIKDAILLRSVSKNSSKPTKQH